MTKISILLLSMFLLTGAQAQGGNVKIAISVKQWKPTSENNKVIAVLTGAGSDGTNQLGLEDEQITIDLTGTQVNNNLELRSKAAQRANELFPGLNAQTTDVQLY